MCLATGVSGQSQCQDRICGTAESVSRRHLCQNSLCHDSISVKTASMSRRQSQCHDSICVTTEPGQSQDRAKTEPVCLVSIFNVNGNSPSVETIKEARLLVTEVTGSVVSLEVSSLAAVVVLLLGLDMVSGAIFDGWVVWV